MNLGYVSYVNPLAWDGGGEQVARDLLGPAKDFGHEVTVWALWPQPHLPPPRKVDGWIVADARNLIVRQRRPDQRLLARLPATAGQRWRDQLRSALSGPYVHLDNAYVDTCDEAYLPCCGSPVGECCPARPRRPCIRRQWSALYNRARLCCFVSPLQRDTTAALQPSVLGKAFVVRPTFNPTQFLHAAAASTERDIDVLYVGVISEGKGYHELVDIEGLTVVTPYRPNLALPRARVVVGIPHQEMPGWYGKAERFFFRPRWPEPFGRTVAEAALAGCHLDVRGRVGALSFDLPPSDPRLYEGAVEEFWRAVEGVMG